MITVSYQINKKLEILFEDGAIGKSIIQEIDEDYLYLGIPMNEGMYYPLNRGDLVEGYYTDDKGNIYKFKSEVVGRKHDKIPLIIINIPTEVHKVQRRRYVRVDYVTEISYALLKDYSEETKKNILQGEFIKGYSLDISGGGMRAKISSEVKLGDHIMVSVPIESYEFVSLCKVTRIERDQESKLFICGLAFKDMDGRTREKIIEFIFKAMRKTIRSK